MDPNAALSAILAWAELNCANDAHAADIHYAFNRYQRGLSCFGRVLATIRAELSWARTEVAWETCDAADSIVGLCEWLGNGGFRPDAPPDFAEIAKATATKCALCGQVGIGPCGCGFQRSGR